MPAGEAISTRLHRLAMVSLLTLCSLANYRYKWVDEDFILYIVAGTQHLLKERRGSEHPLGPQSATYALIKAVAGWLRNILTITCTRTGNSTTKFTR